MDSTRRVAHPSLKLPVYWVSVLALLWPLAAGAQHEEPTVAVCNHCTTGFDFSRAAAEAAEFEYGNGIPGETDEVYVVNIGDSQVLAYRVSRTLFDPDPSRVGDESVETTVTPIQGDPGFLDALQSAMQVIVSLSDPTVQDIPADELDLPFDSALDLIGPVPGSASLNQRTLENSLTNFFDDFWRQQLVALTDLVKRVVERFLFDEGLVELLDEVIVVFGDGSIVRVEVESIAQELDDPVDINIRFEVDADSVQVPGQAAVPLFPEELDGFSFTTPNPGLSQNLRDLLRRLGADISGPPGGGPDGTCTTTSCSDAGVDEQGNPVFSCTTSVGDC